MKGLPNKASFTISELADAWECHPRTVYRKIVAGELPAEKRIGGWRIPREAVLDWERRHRSNVLLGVQYEFLFPGEEPGGK